MVEGWVQENRVPSQRQPRRKSLQKSAFPKTRRKNIRFSEGICTRFCPLQQNLGFCRDFQRDCVIQPSVGESESLRWVTNQKPHHPERVEQISTRIPRITTNFSA